MESLIKNLHACNSIHAFFETWERGIIENVDITVIETKDTSVPVFNSQTINKYNSLFSLSLSFLQDLSRIPIKDILSIYFPSEVVPENAKWTSYQALTDKIRETLLLLVQQEMRSDGSFEQQNQMDEILKLARMTNTIALYARRAIVALQCEIPIASDSDIITLMRIFNEFQCFKDVMFQNELIRDKAQQVLCHTFEYDVRVRLMVVLMSMMWGDTRTVNCRSELTNLVDEVVNTPGFHKGGSNFVAEIAALPVFSDETTNTVIDELSGDTEQGEDTLMNDRTNTSTSASEEDVISLAHIMIRFESIEETVDPNGSKACCDRYLILAALIVKYINSLYDLAVIEDNQMTILWSKYPFAMLLAKYFYQLHCESYNEYLMDEHYKQDRESNNRVDIAMQRCISSGLSDEEIRNKFQVSWKLTAFMVPMQYRNGHGGDRDPNTVLRTLFALRRDEMQNVRVCVDKDKGGFKLVAKRAIKKGEVYLVEKPFASFNGHAIHTNPQTCAYCNKCTGLMPLFGRVPSGTIAYCPDCGECYCSAQCRQAAYDSYHKKLCIETPSGQEWLKLIQFVNIANDNTGRPYNMCLAAKLMDIAECRGYPSVFDMPEIKCLHSPFDTNEPIDSQGPLPMKYWDRAFQMRRYCQYLRNCVHLLPWRYCNLLDVVKLHGVIARNAIKGPGDQYSIGTPKTDEVKETLESQLFLAASFANHSCGPNTDYIHEYAMNEFGNSSSGGMACIFINGNMKQAAVSFKALRDIALGEEITISYCSKDEDNVHTRQDELFRSYDIVRCACSRCNHDSK